MRECFVITSYCDTDEKLNILKSTIKNIKEFGVDVLIHAHYPLPIEIQNDVNYYINSENFIDRSRALFFWIKKNNYKIYNYYLDFSYSVIKQYRESVSYLISLEYDVLHFLNYDSYITQDLYAISKKYCENKSVFYQNFTSINDVIAIWFSLNKKDQNYYMEIFSYDVYKNSEYYEIERYLGANLRDSILIKLDEYDYKTLCRNEMSFDGFSFDDVYNKKSLSSLHFSKFFDKEGYSIFGGFFNKTFAILFYNIKKRLFVNIKINDKLFNIIIENDIFFMDTGIEIEYLKENNNIVIEINNDVVDGVLIDRFLQNKIELIDNDKW